MAPGHARLGGAPRHHSILFIHMVWTQDTPLMPNRAARALRARLWSCRLSVGMRRTAACIFDAIQRLPCRVWIRWAFRMDAPHRTKRHKKWPLGWQPMATTLTYYSPLRYPGGKRNLARFVASICRLHNIDGHYVEPYAGGAAVGLHLLFTDHVKEITINDRDLSIYAFWKSVVENADELCSMIRETKVDIETWNAARKTQKNKMGADILELGFSTFFLNRTNYSGILNGGVLGGKYQTGRHGIDARFNKQNLIERIMKISRRKKHIRVGNMDAMDLVTQLTKKYDKRNTLYYFDPPYYSKGAYLYMNHYKRSDHENIAKRIQEIKQSRWIISYDNVSDIQEYYTARQKFTYTLYHTARSTRVGNEILFFSDNLRRWKMAMGEIPNGRVRRNTR